MTLTTFTVDGVALEAYASIAEAKHYLITNLTRWPAWLEAGEERQKVLLVAATRRLDLLRYVGKKKDLDQETKWPRVNTGVIGADDTIPTALVNATALMAGSMATTPALVDETASVSNVKSQKMDVLSQEFFSPTRGAPLQDRTSYRLLRNAGLLGERTALTSLLPFSDGGTRISIGNNPSFNQGGGGVSTETIQADVRLVVSDWAQKDNEQPIPVPKIPGAAASVATWARSDNDSDIPASKLTQAPLDVGMAVTLIQENVEQWAVASSRIDIPADRLANAPGLRKVDDTLTVDSDGVLSVARAIPDGGLAGQLLSRTATGYDWVVPPQGTGGGGGNGLDQSQVDARVTAGVLSWARTGNTDKVPKAKLPQLQAISLGTALPAPDASEFGNLYGIGVVENGQDETQSLHYLKHRDDNTVQLQIGRIDDEAYGYSADGGAFSPIGVAPEYIRKLAVVKTGDVWNFEAIVVITNDTPFTNETEFRFQWRPVPEPNEPVPSWNAVTLNRETGQESKSQFVQYKSVDLTANPWPDTILLDIEFRSQTGTNVPLRLFTNDAFATLADTETVTHARSEILTRLADNKAAFDRRLALVETPSRVLLGTWERSAAGVSSSTQALTSAITADQESFFTYELEDIGNVIQKRASESVFTAAGTNLVETSRLNRRSHAPSTGDNNRFRWRHNHFDFNIYLLRLTDLDDNVIWEQLESLPFKANLLNEDHQPFEGVFVNQSRDTLTATLGALVTVDSRRLRIWGLKI